MHTNTCTLARAKYAAIYSHVCFAYLVVSHAYVCMCGCVHKTKWIVNAIKSTGQQSNIHLITYKYKNSKLYKIYCKVIV